MIVDDGSRDATAEIADRLAAAHPDLVRVVHHETNRGYGAALRSGFRAARFGHVAFTDGDRQFRIADLGRLTARMARPRPPGRRDRLPHPAGGPDHPDDLRPDLPAGQPDLLRPAGDRRRLRLQALPPRGARRDPGRIGRRLPVGRAADQAPGARPIRRRGRRPALPAHGGLADRGPAAGDRPGGSRLLDAPAADVGVTGSRAVARGSRSWATDRRPASRRPGRRATPGRAAVVSPAAGPRGSRRRRRGRAS